MTGRNSYSYLHIKHSLADFSITFPLNRLNYVQCFLFVYALSHIVCHLPQWTLCHSENVNNNLLSSLSISFHIGVENFLDINDLTLFGYKFSLTTATGYCLLYLFSYLLLLFLLQSGTNCCVLLGTKSPHFSPILNITCHVSFSQYIHGCWPKTND